PRDGSPGPSRWTDSAVAVQLSHHYRKGGFGASIARSLSVPSSSTHVVQSRRLQPSCRSTAMPPRDEIDEVRTEVAIANRILAELGLASGLRASLGHASLRLPSDPNKFVV